MNKQLSTFCAFGFLLLGVSVALYNTKLVNMEPIICNSSNTRNYMKTLCRYCSTSVLQTSDYLNVLLSLDIFG